MKGYVAGGMRDLPFFNFPAFDAASFYGREFLEWEIFNPADHDREMCPTLHLLPGFREGNMPDSPFTLAECMEWDLAMVARADAIILLPGWESSEGANLELHVARKLNKQVFFAVFEGKSCTAFLPEVRPQIIGLAGYAQSGKDTAAEFLAEEGFERIAFADALKAVLRDTDPALSVAWNEKPNGWPGGHPLMSELKQDKAFPLEEDLKKFSDYRRYLQNLGVAAREHIADDVWVQAALRNVKPGGKYVITDVRFPNEARAIEALGGTVVRVRRPGFCAVNGHISETALDDWNYIISVINEGTLEEYKRAVTWMLDDVKAFA